ncbi:putative 18S rRNA (guanine-N(7))-methyltransferase [Nosema granulosis]|uniref:18S rRNA (Guanine-N(7))-methyltransferase n=1 Tax=Nosema granulosis TaxID=83296 RepID=A0A9P6GXJ0_9MICR|nr:putative 18S rRNA (guanine-N(7))-methyltransferase [Nosema granulosis]
MLDLCREKEECLELCRIDIGEGMHFLPGTFDAIISVSAIQWLFQTFKKEHDPRKRIRNFFTSLYSISKTNTRCVLQFYLKNKKDVEILKNEALRAGFHGGIHIEKPNTRHEKQYLVLDSSYALSKKGTKRTNSNKKPKKTKKNIK